MPAVYILSAVRTPIGKFGGSLASLTAVDMGVAAAKAALERAGVQPQQVVIIEDAGPGIEAARRSGAHVCEVTGFEEVDYRRISSFIQNIERTTNAQNSDAAQRSRPGLR